MSERSESGTSTRRRRRGGKHAARAARGEPMLWLTGSALLLCLTMVLVLLGWVFAQGFATFWPQPIVRIATTDGAALGEVARTEMSHVAADGSGDAAMRRRLIRTDNYERTGTRARWIADSEVMAETYPEWAVVAERLEWGRLCGEPTSYAEIRLVDEAESLAAQREATEALTERLVGTGEAAVDDNGAMLWFVQRTNARGQREDLLVPAGEVASSDVPLGVAIEVRRGAEPTWNAFEGVLDEVETDRDTARSMRKSDIGRISSAVEQARIELREVELETGPDPGWVVTRIALRDARVAEMAGEVTVLERRLAAIEADLGKPPEAYLEAFAKFEQISAQVRGDFDEVTAEIERVETRARRHAVEFELADGQRTWVRVADIVRAYAPNQLGLFGKLGVYMSRWGEFLGDEPRESNLEGGVFPAIFGTVLMTLLMCVMVVPFGVLSALYLREYARNGPVITLIRIAITNLAGVPSIVFGVFGLGFFCYLVGVSIDELLFEAKLPAPTFGKSGMLWASLTLALMTLPVVIVATEEALSAVPGSARQGSYACGASRWQTIRRIVLPRAMPGIMTGAILAMARGAGEVAPLMLVGAVKLAPELPFSFEFPFGLDRSFMHLGFHIFDLGFQSPNAEAARPMVYTTTLLLISIIAVLNLGAIWLRSRLRRKFEGGQF